MKRLTRIGVVSSIAVLIAAACGKSSTTRDECTTGTERCSCDRNGMCDEGLECRSDLCVDPGASGTAGGGGEPAGGSGNVSGSESGGRGGTSGRGGSGGRGGTATGGSGDGGEDTGGTSGAAGEPSGGTGGSGGMGGRPVGGAGSGGTSPGGVGGMLVGGAGAGGMAAGSGGMPIAGMGGDGCGARVAAPSDTLIDDLEDLENAIAPPRVGYWFTFTDGSCTTAVPPPDPSGANPFPPTAGAGQNASVGARFYGSGCMTWGAGLGFDLVNCASRALAYDATVFSGVSFWYKSVTPLRFLIATTAVIPTTRGGTCVPSTGMGMECDNPHGADVPASASGRAVSIPFNSLSQTFGQMKAFDKSQLVLVEFQVAQGTGFDFTVDNVAFVP